MRPICIYHANCADGFAAAWVVRRALHGVEFHAATYGSEPPDVTGRQVFIVDFSYPRSALVAMAEVASDILILDHHKTAAADLVDLPGNVKAVFDMDHSGAMLAWLHFFPDQNPPELIKHIEDRDLWHFALPGTREISAALFSYPYDFSGWDALMRTPPEVLLQEGLVLERKHDKDVRELLRTTRRELIIAGIRVPAANLPPTMASDAGHILAEGAPFAAIYIDTATGRQFSLRSTDQGLDASEIAKKYGGGGHRKAAGFRVSFDVAAEFEVGA